VKFRIIIGCGQKHANAPHPLALLRPRCQRPSHYCAAEKRDEIAPANAKHRLPPRPMRSCLDGKDSTQDGVANSLLHCGISFVSDRGIRSGWGPGCVKTHCFSGRGQASRLHSMQSRAKASNTPARCNATVSQSSFSSNRCLSSPPPPRTCRHDMYDRSGAPRS
jgi:hypothetical protein